MSKSMALPHLGHKSADVRGVAQAMADGDHCNTNILNDTLMDAGETLMGDQFVVGEKYYIETLTKYYIGKCVAVTGSMVTLDSAVWVASTGYPTEFFKTGKSENLEVEILGNGWRVPIGMITGSKVWPFAIWTKPVRGSEE